MAADLKYAWPYSVNAANFLTVKPSLSDSESRSNFENWKVQMLCLLQSQDLMGFVDGKTVSVHGDEEDRRKWKRSDSLVKGWILGSVERDVLSAVRGKPTARDIWLELDNIFNQQGQQPPQEEEEEEEIRVGRGGLRNRLWMSAGVDLNRYLPLYQAALKGDWEFARNFFPDINQLCTTRITFDSETVLHIALLAGESNSHFVNQLVRMTPPEQLALRDADGGTALINAAMVGNKAAATDLVFKKRELLRIPDYDGRLPVLMAGVACHKETLEYLISEHGADREHDPLFRCHEGVQLLSAIIFSEFVDIALDLAQRYPDLATLRENPQQAVPQLGEEVDYSSALSSISETPALFPRAETFTWWEWFIYHCIPNKKLQREVVRNGDIENLTTDGAAHNSSASPIIFAVLRQKLENFIPFVIENLVPTGKEMTKKKTTRQQALQLTEFLCKKIASELPHEEAYNIFKKSMFIAIKYGISEIVENIIHEFPMLLYQTDDTGKNIIQMAASYRYENVFNLVYNVSGSKYSLYYSLDNDNNSLLHTCGRLAPPSRLNLVAGAALQMQRELQWFKETENFVDPARRTWPNKAGKTPQMVFTEAHNKLKADGEKWMKDTATACSISATLIATVVFAAALTVPGGLGSGDPSGVPFGVPFFTGQSAFKVFAIADTISLFASITSLLMFLSILTARYAEEDFLYNLPNKLCMGLLSLFVSITSMLVAFGATLYLLLRRDMALFPVLLSIFVCLPIVSLALLQLPLFVHVFYATHGLGIFGKKGNKIL